MLEISCWVGFIKVVSVKIRKFLAFFLKCSLNMDILYFDLNFIYIYFYGRNLQSVSTGSGNGLVLIRQLVIT